MCTDVPVFFFFYLRTVIPFTFGRGNLGLGLMSLSECVTSSRHAHTSVPTSIRPPSLHSKYRLVVWLLFFVIPPNQFWKIKNIFNMIRFSSLPLIFIFFFIWVIGFHFQKMPWGRHRFPSLWISFFLGVRIYPWLADEAKLFPFEIYFALDSSFSGASCIGG